ncbi:unnamed protein product [Lactuca virosa]|uniref:Uncharacterized protein n=1 Tax=Lactuca virosa TaxID=75947 RepID=A0AAU9PB30_9ASTR|nr:unnamed protein product [Lactuca virosa]
MGKCNLNPLYLIRRDTDLSSIDWCDFIVDCLVRTEKVYNPEKESSFFYGPATYLMLLYVDSFKFDHLQVTRKRPTIFYWTSEKIRFLKDILQENGGFGCGDVNEPYVEEECQESEYNEEESGGDEDESDGDEDLCDDDEEDCDVNKVSVVEVYENKISYMYQKMEDLKKDLVVKIDEGVLKFPQNYGNDFLNDDENVEDDDQGKCSGGQGDGSGPHEGNMMKDDEQGNGSGFNEEEAMNLNYVVENVTKSVGLIDSQEGTENLVAGCINQKRVEDDVNENLTGFEKNEFDDRTVNLGEDDKVIVAKNDGEETVEDGLEIIQLKDSKETQSRKKDKVEGKVEKFSVPSFSLGFSQDSEGFKKSSQS